MATWDHQETRRWQEYGKWCVRVRFTRNTGETVMCTFSFASEAAIALEGPVRLANKKARLELKRSSLNHFDIGDGSRDIMKAMIVAIRNTPDATLTQFVNWYNTNYHSALWKAEGFIFEARKWIKKEFGVTPSWDQFKTYVINNVFTGVDG